MYENQVTIEGEVGSEPFKKAVKETTVCSFDLVHRSLRGGDLVDERFPVELWGAIAESFAAAMGDPLLVFGRLHEARWTRTSRSRSSTRRRTQGTRVRVSRSRTEMRRNPHA